MQVDDLPEVFDRMAEVMAEVAARHRENGEEDKAKHCAGGAEAWSLAGNYVRLRMAADGVRNLKVVS